MRPITAVVTSFRNARGSFEHVFRSEYNAVRRYVLRRADPALADDVVAETFLVAWRRFDDVPAQPRPWLLGVARRVLAEHLRAQRRRDSRLTRVSEVLDVARGLALAEEPSDDAVVRAVERLPAGQREALLLTAWENLPPREVAVVLGSSSLAVRVRLHAARARLRRELAQHRPAPRVQAKESDV